ncbi:UDENN FLCN/SMCR8-type domain-containing protein [Entamoeba marina]
MSFSGSHKSLTNQLNPQKIIVSPGKNSALPQKTKQTRIKDIFNFWGYLWYSLYKTLESYNDGQYLTHLSWKVIIRSFTPCVSLKYITLINISTGSYNEKRVEVKYTGPYGEKQRHHIMEGYAMKQNIRKEPLLEACYSNRTERAKLLQKLVPIYYSYDYGTIKIEDKEYTDIVYSTSIPFMTKNLESYISVSFGLLIPTNAEFRFDKLYDIINHFIWNFVCKHICTKGKGDESKTYFIQELHTLVKWIEEYIVVLEEIRCSHENDMKKYDSSINETISPVPKCCSSEDSLPNQEVKSAEVITPILSPLVQSKTTCTTKEFLDNDSNSTPIEESPKKTNYTKYMFLKNDKGTFLSSIIHAHLLTQTTIVIPSDGRILSGINEILSPFNNIEIFKPKTVFGKTISPCLNPLIDVPFIMEIPNDLQTQLAYPYSIVDTTENKVYISEEMNFYDYFNERYLIMMNKIYKLFKKSSLHNPNNIKIFKASNYLEDICRIVLKCIHDEQENAMRVVFLKMVETFKMKAHVLMERIKLSFKDELDMHYFTQLKMVINCVDLEDVLLMAVLSRNGYPSIVNNLSQHLCRAITLRENKYGDTFI